jgi:hypothetical protein
MRVEMMHERVKTLRIAFAVVVARGVAAFLRSQEVTRAATWVPIDGA